MRDAIAYPATDQWSTRESRYNRQMSALVPRASGDAAAPRTEAPWTTRRLLAWMSGYFQEREIDSPRIVAEMLLAHVLACPRMRLYMEVDRPASGAELATLRGLVARAGAGEPVQFLIGEAFFYWRGFQVGRCTLIPQPSTETLVDHVLQRFRERGEAVRSPEPHDDSAPIAPATAPPRALSSDGPRIADIGTGTGCIAVSLAAQMPRAEVVATDILPEALELARANARRYGVEDRIDFRLGAGVEPLVAAAEQADRFDALCANPPYIPDDEVSAMDDSVRRHVPRTAWYGGADGLSVIAPLIGAAGRFLVPGGILAIEIADRHRDRVLALVRQQTDLQNGRVLKDHEGFWRVLVAERASG